MALFTQALFLITCPYILIQNANLYPALLKGCLSSNKSLLNNKHTDISLARKAFIFTMGASDKKLKGPDNTNKSQCSVFYLKNSHKTR